jgi:GcrA cell cycle regulator
MDWTDAVILSLRALWDEGLSTAEIGRRLGVTKNAVVGKAHRLELPARPSPIRRGVGPAAPRRATGPTLPSMEQPDAPPPLPDQGERAGNRLAPHAAARPDNAAPPPAPDLAVAAPRVAAPIAALPVAPAATRPAVATAPAGDAPRSEPVAPPEAPRLVPVRAAAAPRPVSSPRRTRVVACCWPIGEPGTRSFRFCDAESMAGKPYCDTHAQLAYVKVRDRRDDAA